MLRPERIVQPFKEDECRSAAADSRKRPRKYERDRSATDRRQIGDSSAADRRNIGGRIPFSSERAGRSNLPISRKKTAKSFNRGKRGANLQRAYNLKSLVMKNQRKQALPE